MSPLLRARRGSTVLLDHNNKHTLPRRFDRYAGRNVHTSEVFFEIKLIYYWILWSYAYMFLIIKINDFRGDLSDNSATLDSTLQAATRVTAPTTTDNNNTPAARCGFCGCSLSSASCHRPTGVRSCGQRKPSSPPGRCARRRNHEPRRVGAFRSYSGAPVPIEVGRERLSPCAWGQVRCSCALLESLASRQSAWGRCTTAPPPPQLVLNQRGPRHHRTACTPATHKQWIFYSRNINKVTPRIT